MNLAEAAGRRTKNPQPCYSVGSVEIPMATAAAKPAPRVLTFLKHGVVIPARRCGLFLQVFALSVVLSTVLRQFELFVLAPLAAAADADFHRIITRDDRAAAVADPAALLKSFAWDHKRLLLSCAAYVALYLAAGLVTKVATVSAAVASFSGERRTSAASFLRRMRGDLLPGLATAALGCALKAACAGAGAAALLAMPLIVYWHLPARLVPLAALLALVAFHFYFYLDVVCTVAVVSSAAEPGRRGGAGAVARAWRLMRGATARALVYVAVTWALGETIGPARDLAVDRLLPHGWGGDEKLLVKASVEYVQHFAVQVFAIAAITAHYFECRESTEDDKAGHVD
ncbi:hypothetical protein ACP70R_003191 [Stipagrostis hirtigluma subsp. patula]